MKFNFISGMAGGMGPTFPLLHSDVQADTPNFRRLFCAKVTKFAHISGTGFRPKTPIMPKTGAKSGSSAYPAPA